MADTTLKQVRLSLGVTQEQVLRRTRSVSLSTLKNAESGKRVTFENAMQILEAINALLADAGRDPLTFEELGLALY